MNRPIDNARNDNRERGSVALLMAASLTFLFGLAALAVDAGFLYTQERSLQTVADSAALAGGNGLSNGTAVARATAMATQNGYVDGVGGNAVSVTLPAAKQIQVAITHTQPFIFGRIFGFASKSTTGTAIVGQAPGAPAIWAGGGCGSSTGLILNGGPFAITGDLQSNGPLADFTGGGDTDTGSVTNSNLCAPPAAWRGPPPTLGIGQGPPTPDPWGYNIASFPPCNFGSLAGPDLNLSPIGAVPPGIYCTGGDVNLGVGAPIVAFGVTFLAMGHINIGSPAIADMTPAAGCDNLIGFAMSPDNCVGGTPAINVGNSNVTIHGSFYAPLGCLNMGGPSFNITGSLVGNEVNLAGPSWTIDGGAGGGGGPTTLFQ
jgi:hypothetical protein